MTQPKIAVFGAGLMGKKHIKLAAQKKALAAIVDPAPEARDLAREYNAPYYAEIGAALASEKIDGAIIATPNQMHADHAALCLHARIPCLIEKPLTDSLSSAQSLVDLVKKTQTPILVGQHRRHNPLITRAKEFIESGALGQILLVNALFCLIKPRAYYDQDWRCKKGAGPIFINLIHDLDLLRYLCGDIASLQAFQSNAARGFEVEDSAVMTLAFQSGALGTIGISDAAPAPWSWEFTAKENPAYPHIATHAYTISGSKGSLSIPDLTHWYHPEDQSWWAPMTHKQLTSPKGDPFLRQFDHFLKVIRREEAPLATAEDGLKNLRLLEDIKASATKNTPLDAA